MEISKKSGKQRLIIFLKGLAMGSADIVPGVSGGTVAFITGIYQELIRTIRSFDLEFARDLSRRNWQAALERANLGFLLPLAAGIALALISLARLVSYLLEHQADYTWSFFFGLILASVVHIGSRIRRWAGGGGLGFIGGALAGYAVVGLIPVETPDGLWFIGLSGAIAICAMILPGISGSFILLLLSKYEYMINILKNPFADGHPAAIMAFALGCALGLAAFSRLLGWMFRRYYNLTIALLTGFIAGSLRKIWPWKEALESRLIHGELRAVREANILPELSADLLLAAGFALAGFLLVALLGWRAKGQERPTG